MHSLLQTERWFLRRMRKKLGANKRLDFLYRKNKARNNEKPDSRLQNKKQI